MRKLVLILIALIAAGFLIQAVGSIPAQAQEQSDTMVRAEVNAG
jgi:hypothetical protein